MKVHLRSNPGHLYYAGPKRWVGEVSGALDLESVVRASQLARDQQLAQAEVILRFKDLTTQVALPVWPAAVPGA